MKTTLKFLFTPLVPLTMRASAKSYERGAMDNECKIFLVDRKMERRYAPFSNYQPFFSAVLLRNPEDSTYVLEIHYKKGRPIRAI
jgi:hypothetical protein